MRRFSFHFAAPARPLAPCLFVLAGTRYARTGGPGFPGWKNRRKTEQFVSAAVGSVRLRPGHKSARSSLKYGRRGDIWIWARRSEQEPRVEPKSSVAKGLEVVWERGEQEVAKVRSKDVISPPMGVAGLFATGCIAGLGRVLSPHSSSLPLFLSFGLPSPPPSPSGAAS